MRTVEASAIEKAVKDLFIDVNYNLRDGVSEALNSSLRIETSQVGREVLSQLLQNLEIAKAEKIPACQDTGVAVVLVELGQEARVQGGSLLEAVNRGVAQACKEGYLRASVVKDPIRRGNTGDNTPAVVHVDVAPGDQLKIAVMAKGTGAENMSQLKMLTPAEGLDGVKQFVLQVVEEAGANACPPMTIGVGLGGTFDYVGWLAKKALLRAPGVRNKDPFYANLELELLQEINKLGIGPMGLGGRVTALDVRIEAHPCHIGALPVAVNVECHAHRVKEVAL